MDDREDHLLVAAEERAVGADAADDLVGVEEAEGSEDAQEAAGLADTGARNETMAITSAQVAGR